MTLEEKYNLSCYEELTRLDRHENVYLVRNQKDENLYVKKVLDVFHGDVYRRLLGTSVDGIPYLYELFEDDGKLIIIEEYIAGETLDKKIKRELLNEEQAMDYINQLCKVLKYLHHLIPPIIHRDIKPSNIIITRENTLYLIDFNAAREYQKDGTKDTELIGTKEYAAPEQYGFRQTDQRTDIYAVGILLNQMLTGEFPKDQLVEGNLKTVVRKCIEMDPEKRYQGIEQINFPGQKKQSSSVDSLRIPGFRSMKNWKMVLASISYLFILYIVVTMEVRDPKGEVVTQVGRLLANRIIIFLAILGYIMIPANYLNCQEKLFGLNRLKIPWRFLVSLGCSFLFMILLIMILVIIENVFW